MPMPKVESGHDARPAVAAFKAMASSQKFALLRRAGLWPLSRSTGPTSKQVRPRKRKSSMASQPTR